MAHVVAEPRAAEEAALTACAPAVATCAFPFGRQSARVLAYLNINILRLCDRF